jgi:hypothetical protein
MLCYTVPPSETESAGEREQVFMASNQQTMKLYWVTTQDHDEDWFIFAESAKSARTYYEDYEGYGKGDAHSRLIVSDVTLREFQNGTPPCHAQFQDLFQIGFQDAGTIPNRRKVRFNGEIFREGILESIIELGRKQMAAVMDGGLQLNEASSSTAELDSVAWSGNRTVDGQLGARLERSAEGCGGLLSDGEPRAKKRGRAGLKRGLRL